MPCKAYSGLISVKFCRINVAVGEKKVVDLVVNGTHKRNVDWGFEDSEKFWKGKIIWIDLGPETIP